MKSLKVKFGNCSYRYLLCRSIITPPSGGNGASKILGESPMPSTPSSFVIGSFAGGVGSLVGLGGTFIALPFLTSIYKVPQHKAHGSCMAAVLATSLGAGLAYSLKTNGDDGESSRGSSFLKNFSVKEGPPEHVGTVNILAATCLALASSVTVVLGAKISKRLSEKSLRLGMAIFLLSMAPTVPLRSLFTGPPENKVEDRSLLKKCLIPAFIGSFSGVIAGLFGVGGGAITVPCLCIFGQMDYLSAVGTSFAAMLPTALSGCIAHFRQGTLIPRLSLPLGAGCLIGSFFGAQQASKVDVQILQYAFPLVTGTLGILNLVKVLRNLR